MVGLPEPGFAPPIHSTVTLEIKQGACQLPEMAEIRHSCWEKQVSNH
jgi:hypothetical protein